MLDARGGDLASMGEAKTFRILSEESVAAGTRRAPRSLLSTSLVFCIGGRL